MSHKPGSLLGGILLITGSCVGAGMLGLPILTGLAGFFPALGMFICAWLFMTATALLLVEANSWFSHRVNLLSMVEHSLGKIGRVLCWVIYLFLFYAVLVAYITGSGSLFSSTLHEFFRCQASPWIGSLFFVIVFGLVVYFGTRQVDLWNRVMMGGKILFFLALFFVGAQYIRWSPLLYTEPSLAVFSLPILVISFGFHNMIPSLTAYMQGDIKKVRLSILGGSLLAFAIYLIWEVLVLGVVPVAGPSGILEMYKMDKEGSQALAAAVDSRWIDAFAQGFGFFAILTSFLAQSLSLVHFLSDGLKISYKKQENAWICLLALFPPLVLSLIYPQLFFKALNFAGGICAVVLFGIFPVLMVWIGRYRKEASSVYTVPGGKILLVFVFAFALFIFIFQLLHMLGWISTS